MIAINKKVILLFIMLGLTFLIYLPGLYGDYVFDDAANILENSKLAITSLDSNSLKAVLLSGDAGPLGRPVSMLTFALNHYFTGFNPFYFKLTNLMIHLACGVLIYFLSLIVIKRVNLKNSYISQKKIPYLALLVSFIWLIHPLNLTSVLYVVQRMTSLSTLFGLSMLLVYCFWRFGDKNYFNTIISLFIMFFLFSLSLLSKESGILFALLLIWLELTIFQCKNKKLKSIYFFKIKLIYIVFILFFGGIFSIFYVLFPYLDPINFLRRDFDLVERLLTESRVIFYYLKLFFYPLLSDLSLYHDDFEISKSLINPITTIYSIVSIFLISCISFFLFKRHPLVLFSWGWFLISQLLESTFINLELVYEHRNYFGTVGFIIVVIYYLSGLKKTKIKPFIYFLGSVYVANLAFTTWQRASIWSNLVDHATFEATAHPKSDRANYQLARIYMKLMLNSKNLKDKEYYSTLAHGALLQAKQSYNPANGAWFADMHLRSYLNQKQDEKNINQLIFNLKNRPYYFSNISFLAAFTNCQINRNCTVDHAQAVSIIAAGLDNSTADDKVKSELYKLLAQYYIAVISDFIKGEEFIVDAIKLNDDVNGRLIFAQIFRLQGKTNEAELQLVKAEEMDIKKLWCSEIATERNQINLEKGL